MVDQSELAFRMLCRRYGTELAYTPMLHSRMPGAPGVSGAQAAFVDRPLIAQFCGDDPQTVLAAAKLLPPKSVDAVDLNCGCPQGIARKGHYGAYLLSEPDVIEGIVSTLDKDQSLRTCTSVKSCADCQDTLNLASRLEAAGASVLCLHGRTKEMKGQFTGPCDWEAIAAVRKRVNIPLIANGGIQTFQDVERCLAATGANAVRGSRRGVMSSEALLEYPALFSNDTRCIYQDELALEYLELAKLYQTPHKQIKAHMFHFLYAGLQLHTDLRSRFGEAKGWEQINDTALAFQERRRRDRETGVAWPDKGWYLRYREPLGKKRKAESEGAEASPKSSKGDDVKARTDPEVDAESA
eukprot:g23002.t1